MIVYIDFNCLKSLSILKTLIALNILKALRAFILLPPPPSVIPWYKTSKILAMTMLPSSQFILSLQYLETPIPANFTNISYINIAVNQLLEASKTYSNSVDIPYDYKDKVIVFKKTKNVKKLS